MKKPTILNVMSLLSPSTSFSSDNDGKIIDWDIGFPKSGVSQPTDAEVNAKLAELLAAYPLQELRRERNQLLAETDWWAGKDVTMSQARKDYRQALRDLPASANPTLDENGQLTNITWPTKPE